jgi:hypothetical protein
MIADDWCVVCSMKGAIGGRVAKSEVHAMHIKVREG